MFAQYSGLENGKFGHSPVDFLKEFRHYQFMSKVEQLESELQKLSPAELQEVRAWLDDFLEDQLPFKPEFEAAIARSELEMRSGLRLRVRKPS